MSRSAIIESGSAAASAGDSGVQAMRPHPADGEAPARRRPTTVRGWEQDRRDPSFGGALAFVPRTAGPALELPLDTIRHKRCAPERRLRPAPYRFRPDGRFPAAMAKPLALCALLAGCATSGAGPDLPLLSPPVEAATPAGLQAGSAPRLGVVIDATLQASMLRDRFFSGSGPTDLMTILASVDQRLAEVNRAGHPACLDQAPVRYTIAPFEHTVTLYAQCFRRFEHTGTGDPGFLQFGEHDGRTSLYVAFGAARLAAIVSPIEGSTEYMVDAWYGVGYDNAAGCGTTGTFDGCSYAVTELYANPVSRSFEMAVAGVGVGFCGVQFGSDGTSLYGVGSIDMETGCLDRTRLCVSATDPEAPGSCGEWPAYVLPAIGRRAGAGAYEFAASRYPLQPNITLDGTHSDSLYFGPLAPTDGAGDLDAVR